MDRYFITAAFASGRKRRIFLGERVRSFFAELCREALAKEKIGLNYIHFTDCGVIVTLSLPPEISPDQAVFLMKNATSAAFRKEFPEFGRMPSIWTRRFWFCTGEYSPALDGEIRDFWESC